MNYSIKDLLPYEKEHQLNSLRSKIRLFKLIEFYCAVSLEAMKCFFYGEYQKFDAQVSENLCQIRAYQLSLTSSHDKRVLDEISAHTKNISLLQAHNYKLLDEFSAYTTKRHSHYTKRIDAILDIEEFLLTFDLQFTLSKNVFFLVQCYILSKY